MDKGLDGSAGGLTGAAAPVIYDTGKHKWRYGEKHIERWYGTEPFYRENYGPCPQCGWPTMDYGGFWSCNNDYCRNASHNTVCNPGPHPDWWNTDIRVKLDGDSWCAFREPFTNLQECAAGFGGTPQLAVNALLAEGPGAKRPEQDPPVTSTLPAPAEEKGKT